MVALQFLRCQKWRAKWHTHSLSRIVSRRKIKLRIIVYLRLPCTRLILTLALPRIMMMMTMMMMMMMICRDCHEYRKWLIVKPKLYTRNWRSLTKTYHPCIIFEDIFYIQNIIIFATKTIQARRTRHAGHCWRSKDEIVSDVLLLTPTYGQSKAGRPARTFIQQLCDDTGCNPEDLSKAMNDRETWKERARDIRASRTSWWWCFFLFLGVDVFVS